MQEPIWSVVETESLKAMQLAASGQANRWRHTIKQARITIDGARVHRAFWKKQAADIQVILDARESAGATK